MNNKFNHKKIAISKITVITETIVIRPTTYIEVVVITEEKIVVETPTTTYKYKKQTKQ